MTSRTWHHGGHVSSIRQQRELLGAPRSTSCYLKLPFFGSRKMAVELGVGRHRTWRLRRIALETAFQFGQPEIWNFGQGSEFTSADFLAPPKQT